MKLGSSCKKLSSTWVEFRGAWEWSMCDIWVVTMTRQEEHKRGAAVLCSGLWGSLGPHLFNHSKSFHEFSSDIFETWYKYFYSNFNFSLPRFPILRSTWTKSGTCLTVSCPRMWPWCALCNRSPGGWDELGHCCPGSWWEFRELFAFGLCALLSLNLQIMKGLDLPVFFKRGRSSCSTGF